MNCQGFKEGLHAYFHGPCLPEERVEIDRHAAQCEACGAFMALCREISCRDFVEFLNQYVDDELEPARRAVFERHLSICQDCTAYLDSYRKTMRLSVQALREASFPSEVPEELLKAILAARKRA
jgi:anti-sigma factor RsiW